MRKTLVPILIAILFTLFCLNVPAAEWTLKVVVNETQFEFTLDEIREMSTAEVEFHDHIYKGVPVRILLARAGVDIGKLESVEVTASDGYKVKCDRKLGKRFDTILAYEMDGELLPERMGKLRLVFPGGRSKMMVKMVEKLGVKLGEWRLTLVADGSEKEYTLSDLRELPSEEVTLDSKVYKGVSLQVFLTNSGLDLEQVQSASVMASDGYRVEYDQAMITGGGLILAYEVNGATLPEGLGTVVSLLKGEGIEVKSVERVIVALKESEMTKRP